MDEPILNVHGSINDWIAIAVAKSYSQMIRRDQLPSPFGTGSRNGTRYRALGW